ncbi:hypothetical protein FD754_024731 [Muntiacus muntjak]|uniref:DDE-1 domain-containing protein n=1 Tax=Muntiacus muntjak TaxID=9888 RepID=A0A5N3UNE1_MUNMU|nr:hypothetical protein FD754_024731 [Muntiacus muntjak]
MASNCLRESQSPIPLTLNQKMEMSHLNEEGIESGYTKIQIFSVYKTAFYWKMPTNTFIARQDKSMCGLKLSKDRLTLLLEANVPGDFKLKPIFIYHSKKKKRKNKTKALKNYAHLLTTWLTKYFQFTVETYCLEEKIHFKVLLLIDNAAGYPRALKEMCKMNSYYFRNAFHKDIAAIDMNAFDVSGRSRSKTFWKGFIILDAIKNTCVWKKLIPTFLNDFEAFKMLVEEVIEVVVEIAIKLELEVEPKDVIELLNLMRKLQGMRRFERIDYNFQSNFMVSNSIECYKEIIHERKIQLMWQSSLLSCFKKLLQSPHPLATTILTSQQPLILQQNTSPAKYYN